MTNNTSIHTASSGQLFHHLVTVNIRTTLPYGPSLLSDPGFVGLLSATSTNLTLLSAAAVADGKLRALLPLGPVLDGAHTSGQGTAWIRLKAELLVASRHDTPDALKASLEALIGTRLNRDTNAPYPESVLPVTGYTLHLRPMASLGCDTAKDAMERMQATERVLYDIAVSGTPLVRTLPPKREIGLSDMILSPLRRRLCGHEDRHHLK